MRKEITMDKYAAMCDRYADADFKCGDWWPTVLEVKTKVEPRAEQYLEYLIWIVETANEPINEEQRAARTYINNLLNKTLVFVEPRHRKKASDVEEEITDDKNNNKSATKDDDDDILNFDFDEDYDNLDDDEEEDEDEDEEYEEDSDSEDEEDIG